MKKKFSVERIVSVLKQAEVGVPIRSGLVFQILCLFKVQASATRRS